MAQREAELRVALGMAAAAPHGPLSPAEAAGRTAPPARPSARPRENSVKNRSRSV
jgi:hypothetical protein